MQSPRSGRCTEHRRITPGELLAYGYTVVFEPLSKGGFNVFVPGAAGNLPDGGTMEEARATAGDAIRLLPAERYRHRRVYSWRREGTDDRAGRSQHPVTRRKAITHPPQTKAGGSF